MLLIRNSKVLSELLKYLEENGEVNLYVERQKPFANSGNLLYNFKTINDDISLTIKKIFYFDKPLISNKQINENAIKNFETTLTTTTDTNEILKLLKPLVYNTFLENYSGLESFNEKVLPNEKAIKKLYDLIVSFYNLSTRDLILIILNQNINIPNQINQNNISNDQIVDDLDRQIIYNRWRYKLINEFWHKLNTCKETTKYEEYENIWNSLYNNNSDEQLLKLVWK